MGWESAGSRARMAIIFCSLNNLYGLDFLPFFGIVRASARLLLSQVVSGDVTK
jgi:hypothetical protein